MQGSNQDPTTDGPHLEQVDGTLPDSSSPLADAGGDYRTGDSRTDGAIVDAPQDVVLPTIVWSADHETGDIGQWLVGGEFAQNNGSYQVVDSRAHTGTYSVSLSIDTDGPGGWYEAVLRRTDGLPAAAYYSAWVFIPSPFEPSPWCDVFVWQSVNASDYDPMFALGADIVEPGGLQLVLRYRPGGAEYVLHTQPRDELISLPRGRWFHLEAFYRRDLGTDGHIAVWQDGTKVFEVSGKPTLLAGGTLYWGIGLFTEAEMSPAEAAIYVDDVAISEDARLGP